MKQRNSSKTNFSFLIFISLILFCFYGCSLKAEQKSLTKQFDTIDALIMQNQMQSAIKELKKTEKQAYDSWSYIGIYKRYSKIGEKDLAEKVIKKALKKNNQNTELLAVYTNHLLRNNKLDEVEKYAEKLQGTKYASLYSELVLKKVYADENNTGDYSFFQNSKFYQVYLDAYLGSKNSIWARNCAVFDVTHGYYERAASLLPIAFADVDDAFFWANVLFDAGNFYDSIEVIKQSQKLLANYQNKALFKTSEIQQVALMSDAYMAVSDMENSEAARQNLVLNVDNLNVRPADEELLSIILLNSAIWAGNQGMDDENANLLFYIVQRWPENVKGLILYADFAYRSNLEREEDTETKALRRAGISSIEMEKYDNRRKVPLSDALYRIDEGIKRTNDPYLNIAKLDLRYKTDKSLNQKDKQRDLWKLIEDNVVEGEKYKMLLVQYALNFLLNAKEYDDAWTLFYQYVTDNGDFNPKRNFWEQFIEQSREFELPIVEVGAWFAADQKLSTEALRLYEYCVYESSGVLQDGFISQGVSTASCMNLADVYLSLGKKLQALDLYGKAAGREIKNSVRSEIFYRIACIYASDGDTKNALRSAEYACSLYPENARASLLKDKLKL